MTRCRDARPWETAVECAHEAVRWATVDAVRASTALKAAWDALDRLAGYVPGAIRVRVERAVTAAQVAVCGRPCVRPFRVVTEQSP